MADAITDRLITLFTDAATTTASSPEVSGLGRKTFQARGAVANSTGAASIDVQGTNFTSPTAQDWVSLGTITLTLGVTSTTDGFAVDAPWMLIRGLINSVSGATPAIDLVMYKEE